MTKVVSLAAGGLAVSFVTAVFMLGFAPSACACGEAYQGSAAFHWDEMSHVERVRYYINGSLPFDETGERK